MRKKNNLPKERHATFAELTARQKVQYIWDYYKLPIFAMIFILFFTVSLLHHYHDKKEVLVHLGAVNILTGETLTQELTEGFVSYCGADPSSCEVLYYTGLYLTTDEASEYYAYNYASQIKILSAIDSEQLDMVLMNQEAFDAFAQNGYLMDLSALEGLPAAINQVVNKEIVEDNAKELVYDSSAAYHSTIREYPMGIDTASFPCFAKAQFSEPVYLGIIANTPRSDAVKKYLEYLLLPSENGSTLKS